MEPVTCQDCGGKGVDLGSLYEPEPCPACLGSGQQLVDLSPSSSRYGQRKPMGVALPHRPTLGELAERGQ